MFVSGDRRYKVFVVSLFYLKFSKLFYLKFSKFKICFNVPTLLYTEDCNSPSNLNIFTIISALESLEYDLSKQIILIFLANRNHIFPEINRKKDTYDDFRIGNVHFIFCVLISFEFGSEPSF